MELNGSHRKWPTAGRRCHGMERIIILFGSMSAFSLMMLLRVDVSKSGGAILWANEIAGSEQTARPAMSIAPQMSMSAMKRIIAYSPEKQAEMDGRFPSFCEDSPTRPPALKMDGNWSEVEGSEVSLYAGYYDDRIPNQPYVRFLAVTFGTPVEDLSPLYCQTWQSALTERENGEDTEVVEASVTQIWWGQWDPGSVDAVTPLLISCALSSPRDEAFNTSVSLTPCVEVQEGVRVTPPRDEPYARNFTVCVKDLRFEEDISARLVEWFELLHLLGAERIELYVGEVPPRVSAVLEYYRERGFARLFAAPRPRAPTLWQRRRDHLIAYNDCLYRNLRTSRYVVPLDVDEVIVPRKAEPWDTLVELLRRLESEPPGAASLAVSNAFFFDSFGTEDTGNYTDADGDEDAKSEDSGGAEGAEGAEATEHLEEKFARYRRSAGSAGSVPHMLSHVYRSAVISPAPQYSKSFVSTSLALAAFNHYALAGLGAARRARAVAAGRALLQHYKAACRPALVDCARYSRARRHATLLRLAAPLRRAVRRAARESSQRQ